MKKRAAESGPDEEQAFPESISGMPTAEVLRKQKQGLMMRLAEQKRQLAALAEQVGGLQRARDEADGAAGALRRAWDALEMQLRVFAARLEPGAALSDLAPDSKLAALPGMLGEAQLEQRLASAKAVLERLAALVSKGGKNDRFDEMHVAFAGLSQRFQAVSERAGELETKNAELKARVDVLLLEVAGSARKNDRLSEELKVARAERAAGVGTAVATAAPGTKKVEAAEAAAEPAEKKHKGGEDGDSGEAAQLARQVEALRAETARLAQERDANLLNARSITEETIKGSAAYVALQTSLAWHVKEQAGHAAVLRDATEALALHADAARAEREKMGAWRREFERSGAEAVAGLRKELAALRRERDDLRARLDAASLATNKDQLVAEVRLLLKTQSETIARLQAEAARSSRAEQARPAEQPEAEQRERQQEREERAAELLSLQSQLAIERQRTDTLRIAAERAEEKLRESSVVLAVWKKSAGDKRELNELRESEAVLKLRNTELVAAAERGGGKDGGGAAAEREKKEYEAAAAAELARLARAVAAAQSGESAAVRSATALREELAQKNAESEALLGEMGNMVGAVEELQRQNERLVAALAQRDDTHQTLVSQKAAARQMETLLREEKNQLVMKMAALKKTAAAQKAQLTHQGEVTEACEAAMVKLQEENQQLHAALDKERLALRDLQKSFFELRARCDEATTGRGEAAKRLETALEEKRALEAQVVVLAGKNSSLEQTVMSYKTRGADVLVQEQLRTLQQAARCSVCNSNYKNTVLTTCFHTFCRDCVNDLITNRSRKCPRCGRPFDKVDVKTVYLDYEELD